MIRSLVLASVLVALSGCGGALAPVELPAACVPTHWVPCTLETLNDGTGPDDHRRVCADDDGTTWILYASGELWHTVTVPDGKSDPVLCHVGPDGSVFAR